MNNYNILMRDTQGDEGWTQCEGSNAAQAMLTAKLRYGRGWRAVQAKLAQPFYQVSDAGTEEEVAALLELRVANLKKGISKPVITPQGEFPSVKDAAAAHNQKIDAFRKRLGRDPGFYYKEVDKTK